MALEQPELVQPPSVRVLAETTGRASYLAYEVFACGGELLPTGRTLPIVAESRVAAGSELRIELRAFGERPMGAGHGPAVLSVGSGRYWIVDRADAFPNAPADIDAIALHRLRQETDPRRAGTQRASCARRS